MQYMHADVGVSVGWGNSSISVRLWLRGGCATRKLQSVALICLGETAAGCAVPVQLCQLSVYLGTTPACHFRLLQSSCGTYEQEPAVNLKIDDVTSTQRPGYVTQACV